MKTPKLNLPDWVGDLSVKKTEFDKLYKKYVSNPVINDNVGMSYNGSQNANEFFAMWGILSQYILQRKLKKVRFLEIGGYKGLWSLMLSHICEKLNVDYEYTTITPLDQDKRNDLSGAHKLYISKGKNFTIINKYSQDPTVVNDINNEYDFVFIDGGHTYDEAFCDFMVYYKYCKSIFFWHDMNAKPIMDAISDSGIFKHEQFSVDMGIGISYVDDEWFKENRWFVKDKINALKFTY